MGSAVACIMFQIDIPLVNSFNKVALSLFVGVVFGMFLRGGGGL